MRRLGAELGVEAMSLYKHVTNKEEVLDGIIELVVGDIETPQEGADWKEAMRRRAISAREVLGRHSWAIGLLEARGSKGPTALRYLDAVLGNLRSAGFSMENAVHAFWLLDSFVYGHVIQETSLPIGSPEEIDRGRRDPPWSRSRMDEYPHLVEIGEHALRSEYSSATSSNSASISSSTHWTELRRAADWGLPPVRLRLPIGNHLTAIAFVAWREPMSRSAMLRASTRARRGRSAGR